MELTQHILCGLGKVMLRQQRLLRKISFRFFFSPHNHSTYWKLLWSTRAFVIRSLYSFAIHLSISLSMLLQCTRTPCSLLNVHSLSPFFQLITSAVYLYAHSLEVLLGSSLALFCQLVRLCFAVVVFFCFTRIHISKSLIFQCISSQSVIQLVQKSIMLIVDEKKKTESKTLN